MAASLKQLEFDRQLDLVLVRDFRKNGNIEIINNLYSKYIFLIYGIGLKYFKSKERAKHLVETIFEKLTIELISREVASLRSWLYVTSRNYCLTELSKTDGESTYKEDFITMESVAKIHPLDDDIRIDAKKKKCFEKLNKTQRNCIELFYYKKLTYREIAHVEGIDEVKVKENIISGKNILTVLFEELND